MEVLSLEERDRVTAKNEEAARLAAEKACRRKAAFLGYLSGLSTAFVIYLLLA